jgi:membrane protease YdiL (CAAX protease family)
VSSRLAELHPRRFFLETWRGIDERARTARAARKEAGLGYDYRPLITFCTGALLLTAMEYCGMQEHFDALVLWMVELEIAGTVDGIFFTELRHSEWYLLVAHAWWALWRVLGFLLLPMLIIKLSRGKISDQYCSTKGFRDHLWIYLLAFAVVFVCVIGVSFTEGFSSHYPFYEESHRSWFDLLTWEVLYILQFLGLEYFFRGWWLRSCESALGSHAIFAMIAPYVMIHFGKEWAETCGAIFAGVFLGTLAMRTRSIWGGFLVHCLVAVSMDIAALLQTTGLPTTFWPE